LTELRATAYHSRMAGEPFRGTLAAFPQWILQQYKKATGKDDSFALTYILERWANLDPEAERYGVSIKAYRQEMEGGEVIRMPGQEKKRTGASER
jgi:hypothetical protein